MVPQLLRFVLISIFLLVITADGSAALIVTTGPFSLDDPKDHSVDVLISDGGQPVLTSITTLSIKVIAATLGGATATTLC